MDLGLSRLNKIKTIIPVFETYEYNIVGYTQTGDYFGELSDTPPEVCGKVRVRGNKKQDDIITSCDSLSSEEQVMTGGYNIDNFYHNYKTWRTKQENFSNNYGDSQEVFLSEESVSNLETTLRNAKTNMKRFLFTKGHEIERTPLSLDSILLDRGFIDGVQPIITNDDIINLYLGDDLLKTTYILHHNIPKTKRVIMFGDYHGSFHTFFRNILRLHKNGILDITTYTINEPYLIIFTGDIADRGTYSLDIIYFLAKLIEKNNNEDDIKIILNRGNHEESTTMFIYGFYNEVQTKVSGGYYFQILEAYYDLLYQCPSAIILTVENERRFWISHGGFPIITEGETDNGIIKISEYIHMVYNESIATQIRWNDFIYKNVTDISSRGDNMFSIGLNDVKAFYKANEIDFVIRGHQDSFGNTTLFYGAPKNTPKPIEEIPLNTHDKNLAIIKNENNPKFGPTFRIVVDSKLGAYGNKNPILPVLTISTNTDFNRPLVRDSFGVLRFDLESSNIRNFSSEQNIFDYRKDTTLNISSLYPSISRTTIPRERRIPKSIIIESIRSEDIRETPAMPAMTTPPTRQQERRTVAIPPPRIPTLDNDPSPVFFTSRPKSTMTNEQIRAFRPREPIVPILPPHQHDAFEESPDPQGGGVYYKKYLKYKMKYSQIKNKSK